MIHTKGLPLFFLGLFIVTLAFAFLFGGDRSINTLASNSTSLEYVALGDSITRGEPNDGSPPFVERYKNYVATDLGVSVYLSNLGVGGLSSTALLDLLKNNQTYRDEVMNAHLISFDTGFVDYYFARESYNHGTCGGADNQDCLRSLQTNLRDNINNIILELKSINPKPGTAILTMTFYNSLVSLDLQAGEEDTLVPYVSAINQDIKTVAAANGVYVADVYLAYNGSTGLEDPIEKGYLLADNIHPNGTGHGVIATQFRNLNYIVLAKDTDADTFSNSIEKYYGTDLLASCPINSVHSAYPPDFNNDGLVRIPDIVAVTQHYFTSDHRYDLDMSGTVTVADINLEKKYYYKDCPN